jgi:hypothetical protein
MELARVTDAFATASSKPATTHVVDGPAGAAILEVAAQVVKGATCSVLVVRTTDSN